MQTTSGECRCSPVCKCKNCKCNNSVCKSDNVVYDVVVIGAGIMGLSTAYCLVQRGYKVLVLEQFPLPHTRGSSHGASRIIRTAYPEAYIADFMSDAMDMWKKLERETSSVLFERKGLLVFSPNLPDLIQLYHKNMKEFKGQPVLTKAELSRDYPLISFSDDDTGTYEAGAGVLYADKCLQAYQKMIAQSGGVIRDGEKVEDLTPGDILSIQTSKQMYRAKTLAVTSGAWSFRVLSSVSRSLPLKVEAIQVCYWKEKANSRSSHSLLPCFMSREQNLEAYGLPMNEYPGLMKICLHYGVPCAPDQRDMVDQNKEAEHMAELKNFVAKRFPYLIPEPAIKERCMYTQTPDHNPIIEIHPQYKNIAYACGFSGHGFKLAPVVGVILSDLLEGKTPHYPEAVKEFSSKRFERNKRESKSKL